MSEAIGIALPADALTKKQLSYGGPCFCAIKQIIRMNLSGTMCMSLLSQTGNVLQNHYHVIIVKTFQSFHRLMD